MEYKELPILKDICQDMVRAVIGILSIIDYYLRAKCVVTSLMKVISDIEDLDWPDGFSVN